ncbi:predicted protein [Botrytis cinerea T4]|uniref:Uncharacterized protein n=1 Tax=Botryotinia fuckeliana (strain T4) TaxID=999810 RepID=G2YXE0_BOTF4|nr:predicted protein [Botrytis cinerea T4]
MACFNSASDHRRSVHAFKTGGALKPGPFEYHDAGGLGTPGYKEGLEVQALI